MGNHEFCEYCGDCINHWGEDCNVPGTREYQCYLKYKGKHPDQISGKMQREEKLWELKNEVSYLEKKIKDTNKELKDTKKALLKYQKSLGQ